MGSKGPSSVTHNLTRPGKCQRSSHLPFGEGPAAVLAKHLFFPGRQNGEGDVKLSAPLCAGLSFILDIRLFLVAMAKKKKPNNLRKEAFISTHSLGLKVKVFSWQGGGVGRSMKQLVTLSPQTGSKGS